MTKREFSQLLQGVRELGAALRGDRSAITRVDRIERSTVTEVTTKPNTPGRFSPSPNRRPIAWPRAWCAGRRRRRMKETKRALRRHHLIRIKARTLANAKASMPNEPHLWPSQVIDRYRNRSDCSCWMCGNPRRHFSCRKALKLTRQEKEAAMREREELDPADFRFNGMDV